MGPLAPEPSQAKPGDDCPSCAEHWLKKKQRPRRLEKLGSTQNRKLMVLVCPYCDGERAIGLTKGKK